jgi:hypothetical protein
MHTESQGAKTGIGADIRRRLFATDVLFASLQREAVGRPTGSVDRDAYETARKNAPVFVAGS